MTKWEKTLKADMGKAMAKAGVFEEVKWTAYDSTTGYGIKSGLVFFGASPETCERAARFFQKWASKHVREYGMIGRNSEAVCDFLGAVEFDLSGKRTKGFASSYVYISSGD